MQTVNIRQLKANPSTALAAAREDDMVVVMNRDHPQALLVDLERLGLPDLPAVRVALAVSLFRSGSVSAGFAARAAGKPLAEDDAEALMDAARFVRRVRLRLGLTQQQFARRIDVLLDTIRNWEQGRRYPTGAAKTLLKILDRAPDAALLALG